MLLRLDSNIYASIIYAVSVARRNGPVRCGTVRVDSFDLMHRNGAVICPAPDGAEVRDRGQLMHGIVALGVHDHWALEPLDLVGGSFNLVSVKRAARRGERLSRFGRLRAAPQPLLGLTGYLSDSLSVPSSGR